MLPRTQRQKEILDYITRFLDRHGYIPSYAQIARQFGVKSRATIAKHIAALERRGLLVREHEDGSFALNVKVEDTSSDSLCEVKVLGAIAAGAPLEVIDYEERIPVPKFLLGRVRPDRVYALRVKGDSMIDEHICDGDIALIENRTDARDGEIVVALLIEENQATLKRIFRRDARVLRYSIQILVGQQSLRQRRKRNAAHAQFVQRLQQPFFYPTVQHGI